MGTARIGLDEAVDLTRTGDVWLFRGRSAPDRAIQITTNSPINHVGMALVLDDLPPLMWHAELGRSLPDLWSGTHHRGVQLHDLRDAVQVWARKYGQRGWFRQLEPPATPDMEDAVLRTVARLDGTPFPSTARLAGRWLRGRVPNPSLKVGGRLGDRLNERLSEQIEGRLGEVLGRQFGARLAQQLGKRLGGPPARRGAERGGLLAADRTERAGALETAYCAEVLAVTYEAMGLLPGGRRPNWYDPGRFWSGDELGLAPGVRLGGEIAVEVPER